MYASGTRPPTVPTSLSTDHGTVRAEAMARLFSFLACLLAVCLLLAPQASAQAGVANTITSAGVSSIYLQLPDRSSLYAVRLCEPLL